MSKMTLCVLFGVATTLTIVVVKWGTSEDKKWLHGGLMKIAGNAVFAILFDLTRVAENKRKRGFLAVCTSSPCWVKL